MTIDFRPDFTVRLFGPIRDPEWTPKSAVVQHVFRTSHRRLFFLFTQRAANIMTGPVQNTLPMCHQL